MGCSSFKADFFSCYMACPAQGMAPAKRSAHNTQLPNKLTCSQDVFFTPVINEFQWERLQRILLDIAQLLKQFFTFFL
jgi:hypothetical protein